MSLDDLQKICRQFKGTTEDLKWEDHLCFNIGGKMYLVTSPDHKPHPASFKASDEDFTELCEREGFMPAPYLARYKWVHVDDINRLSVKQWQTYAQQSYRLIGSKLPARLKKEYGL